MENRAEGGVATSGAERTEVQRELSDVFVVERELGNGSMGQVVAARDRVLGRLVAVKALRPELRRSKSAMRRFVTEAQVAAQLEHPNIVPIYGFEQDRGAPAFTMRLLPGQSLEDHLARCREAVARGDTGERFSLAARIELFLAVCDAVSYAHARGVVHRDLKPENVVLGEHRDVYLVDWGIAKVCTEEELAREGDPVVVSTTVGTSEGELLGTPVYMSPEQASGEVARQGPASDQFGLGMMLQEIATLAPARRSGSLTDALGDALSGVRLPFTKLGDGSAAPPELVAIVARATQIVSEARYPDVDAFAADLRRFARGDEVSVHRDGLARRVGRRLSRRPGIVLATVAALVALVAISISFGLWRSLAERDRAMAEQAALSALSGQVVRRAQRIDAQLGAIATLVEGLGAAGEVLLSEPGTAREPSGWGAAGHLAQEGPALADLGENPRYGMPVSFTTPAFLWPPGVTREDVLGTFRHLDAMRTLLPEAMATSGAPEAATWPHPRVLEYLEQERPPIYIVYLGLEDGLLLNYPGYTQLPEAYDPRRRPWYRGAASRSGTAFGVPYPDASGTGILLPCNRTMRGAEGQLLGVAGADMVLDDVIHMLALDDLDGWQESSLVDADGITVVSTTQAGLRLAPGLHGNSALEGRPIEPEVAAALRSGELFARIGGAIFVFHRLREIDWTLVARFE